MSHLKLVHVPISPQPPSRFEEVVTADQFSDLVATIERARGVIGSRVVWNVNSTARGGGVAELLQSLVGYVRGAGFDARWTVIAGNREFFALTKRIHNRLHGSDGDGQPLGEAERALYEKVSAENAHALKRIVREGDLVLLHDPQTAGLIQPLLAHGARVVWRCHVGLDTPNELARSAWSFLLPYVADAEAYVFSRAAFAWEDLDDERLFVIPPSIDVFTAKNEAMDRDKVAAILAVTGLAPPGRHKPPTFARADGTPGRVDRRAELIEDEPAPLEATLLTQVSRWDRLKDPDGVLAAFAQTIAPQSDARLMLAGPAIAAVTDDPEGGEILAAVAAQRERLPSEIRRRVHLALLPMEDREENAAIVNALQRRSDVVCQKSIAEGFGLTVAEAMWKSRPVVASKVGGIQDQIVDGETGILVAPDDPGAFGEAVNQLLRDPTGAAAMGDRAHRRIQEAFLGPRHLTQYVDVFEAVLRATDQ